MEYFDYQDGDENEMWHHVACVVSQQAQKIWGTLMTHQRDGSFQENTYINNMDSSIMSQFEISQSTPDDKFQIQVNADHRGKNGMAHTFYADVRIWSFAKSAHQIRS